MNSSVKVDIDIKDNGDVVVKVEDGFAAPATTDMSEAQKWWAKAKGDPLLIQEFLSDQYYGETAAAQRINYFRVCYIDYLAHSPSWGLTATVLQKYSGMLVTMERQELEHAAAFKGLLEARGLSLLSDGAFRMNPCTGAIESLISGEKAKSRDPSEKLGNERLAVIRDDPMADADFRLVATTVLREEEFHDKAFEELGNNEALLNGIKQWGSSGTKNFQSVQL